MAMDEPCVDACVDYRALAPNPDPDWVKEVARARLKERMAGGYTDAPRAKQVKLLDEEILAVQKDIKEMVPRLAKIAGRDEQKLEDVRTAVVEKVRMRKRFIWYRNYELAMKKHEDGLQQAQTRPTSVWKKWLLDDGEEEAPELDQFVLKVAEETARHVLIRDVELDVQTEIGKHIDRFPGLELKPGMRRIYPLGRVAAHLLGRMSRVTRQDIENDPNFGVDALQYQQTDLKGRGGLEGLCEPVLRGSRGEIGRLEGREVSASPPRPGQDVYSSIDVELQQEVEALFEHVPIKTKLPDRDVVEEIAMHGAAVVIDVATGEVRVMASAPGYDPNTLDEEYSKLAADDNLDLPLLNRATLALREPGSTVKPMVGLAAATYGVRRPDEGYECTGYMQVNGRYYRIGRCWVNSMFHKVLCRPDCKLLPCPTVAHHPVPYDAKHPTGFLTLADALERSCNPYFESIAHALGPYKLSDWYRKFGLGTRTYIGIAEATGRVPDTEREALAGPKAMVSVWSAGIGQGPVAATPLQMANVAATIARGGVWVRPKLLATSVDKGGQRDVPPTTQAADRVDLQIPPEALAAVREGMWRVVHTKAGSGGDANRKEVSVSGKTGTAEAAWIKVKVRDEKTGKVVLDDKGRPVMKLLELSSYESPNGAAPWYRATGRQSDRPHHSWFMGFAPSEKPQIAFAVMVEYGGSGGGAAGSVASQIVKLCIDHKYLNVPDKEPVAAAPLAPPAEVELLHDVPATMQAAR
jgi:penicillin-binding protein 2